jgi:hypothetical protein
MAKRTTEPTLDNRAQRLMDYQRILGSFASTGSEPFFRPAFVAACDSTRVRCDQDQARDKPRYRPGHGDLLIEAGGSRD